MNHSNNWLRGCYWTNRIQGFGYFTVTLRSTRLGEWRQFSMFVKVQERMKHLRLHLQTTQHASAVSEGESSKTAARIPNAVPIDGSFPRYLWGTYQPFAISCLPSNIPDRVLHIWGLPNLGNFQGFKSNTNHRKTTLGCSKSRARAEQIKPERQPGVLITMTSFRPLADVGRWQWTRSPHLNHLSSHNSLRYWRCSKFLMEYLRTHNVQRQWCKCQIVLYYFFQCLERHWWLG